MADLSGKPEEPLPKLRDRKFVEIDRDNFNDVMTAIRPRLVFQTDNRLAHDDSKLNIELKFGQMDDFDPVNVLKQVEPLRKLYEARQKLSDLLTKLDGNDDLDKLLQDVVASTENLDDLKMLTAGTEEGISPDGTEKKKEPAPEQPEEPAIAEASEPVSASVRAGATAFDICQQKTV